MGYKTTSAERSQATSAVSSAIAAFNNPDGSGFALTSTALTEGKELKQYTVVPGTDPINSETSIGGAVITAVAITDSNYTVLDDTALATTGGYIKLTGTGFKTGCIVYVGGVAATTTTFVSSTEVRAAVGSNSSNTFTVYLVNTDGSAAFYLTGLVVSGVPAWSTGATLAAAYEQAAYTQALSATGDATISYALKAGSNLPSGVSLNSVTGALTGTTPADTGSTTYTFTIIAIDGQNQDTERLFSLTVNTDPVTWASPADGTSYELPADTIMSNVALQATSASGRAVTYSANTLPTGVTLSGNVISGTATVVGQAVSTLLTANNSVRSATRVVNWTVIVASDPYFNNTVLLLNTTATNGAQNNTFLDSSTNNYSITRSGNATQGTFTPFSPTGWSNYFDGSSSFFNSLANTAPSFSTNDFTIEAFLFWPSTASSNQTFFETTDSSRLIFGRSSTGVRLFWYGTEKGFSYSFATNTWYHIALVRSSGTVYCYINGVSSMTPFADSTNISAARFDIGRNSDNAEPMTGYVSNLRVLKGVAQYVSNFTPPTTPLTAITNTSLLTCQSNRFVDNRTNAIAFTISGNPSVQAFSPFAPTAAYDTAVVGGSYYGDGSGDGIYFQDTTQSGTSSSFNLGASNNASVDHWFYLTAAQATAGFSKQVAAPTDWNGQIWYQMNLYDSGTISVFWRSGANYAYFNYSISSIPYINQWNHVALASDTSNNLSLFLNGVRVATTVTTIGLASTTPNYITFGQQAASQTASSLKGYMSGLRFIQGSGAYNAAASTITVPTAPPTATGTTQLLLNCTNAGIFDSTAKNDIETVGNAQVSSIQSKYGGTSMKFDGSSSSWLLIPFSQHLNLSTGSPNWTIECWVYVNSFSNAPFIFNKGGVAAAYYTNYGFAVNSSGLAYMHLGNNGGETSYNFGTISTGTWYHLAGTRSGSTIRTFLDGTLVTNTSIGATMSDNGEALYVGCLKNLTTNVLNGYVDDLRITKGYARYTANFTPPTGAFKLK